MVGNGEDDDEYVVMPKALFEMLHETRGTSFESKVPHVLETIFVSIFASFSHTYLRPASIFFSQEHTEGGKKP